MTKWSAERSQAARYLFCRLTAKYESWLPVVKWSLLRVTALR